MIPSTFQLHNRGAAVINLESMQSGDITLELTGRGDTADKDKLTMRDKLTRAPVQ